MSGSRPLADDTLVGLPRRCWRSEGAVDGANAVMGLLLLEVKDAKGLRMHRRVPRSQHLPCNGHGDGSEF